jgi:S1-C subfamily serine protease
VRSAVMRSPVTRAFLAGVALVTAVFLVLLAVGVFNTNTGTSGAATTPSPAASAGGFSALDPDSDGINAAIVYAHSSPGVVLILSTFPGGGPLSSQAEGTGFVVSKDGYILTNAHVVSNNGRQATSVTVSFKHDDGQTKQVTGKVVGFDNTSDVAVIKVDPAAVTLQPLTLGDSGKVVVGEPVVAIGNPLGFDFSVTTGIISGIQRNLSSPNGAVIPNGLQTDAAINPGNSGGPLIDANNQVIGINEQIAPQTGGFSGLGFAVPINTAKSVMDQLISTGKVKHALLGVSGQTFDAPIAKALKLPVSQGVLIASVQKGSAADKAGLHGGSRTMTLQGVPFRAGGDIVTGLDGQPITSMDQLAGDIAQKSPGDKVTLTVVRGTQTLHVTVTLGARP